MTPQNLNFYDPDERPWPNPRLNCATIIGHTTTTSVRLWFRASEPGNYWLVVSLRPIPTNGTPQIITDENSLRLQLTTPHLSQDIPTANIVSLQLEQEHDLTGVVDLENLQPDTRYYYALIHPNREKPWELGTEEKLSFQTFPEHPTEVNFGMFSCHMPYDEHKLINMEMWETFYKELSDANARFIVGTGDQVYVDGEGAKQLNVWDWLKKVKQHKPSRNDMISWYRDIYRGYWGIPQVQQLFQSFPIYMIWDDHEIMDGWGSYTPKELAAQLDTSWQLRNTTEHLRLVNEMFQAAKQVYYEYEHSHNPPTDTKIDQFDYQFNCGFSAFYVLDMRAHHDYNRQEFRLLDIEQWNRFETWINSQYNSESRILFIVSPVPVVHFNSFIVNSLDIPYWKYTDDFRDHWEHDSNWTERNLLLGKVFEWSQKTKQMVVFLSGDVHMGAAFKLSHEQFPAARVFQLTSSGIAYAALGKFGLKVLETLVKDQGSLGDNKDNVPYKFQNLYLCPRNNFSIIRVKQMSNGELSVIYDLFSSDKDNAKLENKRIELI